MRKLAMGAVVVVISCWAGAGTGGQENPVRLAGIQVVGPGAGTNGSELQAFREQSGITLALIATAPPDRSFVEIDDDGCTLTVLHDDTERNLLDGIDWDAFPKISKDGRNALVEVRTKIPPASSATMITARGSIRARVSAGIETQRIDTLELREGFEFAAFGETLRVMSAADDEGLTLVVQATRSFNENLKDLRFFGADGEPIEVWGRGSMTFGNATQMEFNLNGSSESLSVELDMWQKLETIDLAFQLENGLGLGR